MLPFHPLANLFPLIDGAEFEALCADVRDNDLREKIVVLDGQILDGRNRYRAARAVGLGWLAAEERQIELGAAMTKHFVTHRAADPGGDPLRFVVSLNIHRRHLNDSQRAMIAAEIATLKQGRPSAGGAPPPVLPDRVGGEADKPASLPVLADQAEAHEAGTSQGEAADLMHVSERSVRSARSVRDDGAPELVDAVKRGEVTVSAAAEVARLPVSQQLEILRGADPRAFARVAKERRAETQQDKKQHRQNREAELGARQQALPEAKFGVIYADPEWRFETWSEDGMDRAADNHYPTSPLEAIKQRDIGSLAAEDAVLFLWATAPMLPQALEVMAAWGFDYKSQVIWRKAEVLPFATGDKARLDRGAGSGALVLGTGYWFRNAHELLLVGTRGNLPAPAMGTQFPSVIDAPPLRHSQKPERFYEVIEAYFPNLPKIELNARQARQGWARWGLEAPGEELPERSAAKLADPPRSGSAEGNEAETAAPQDTFDGAEDTPHPPFGHLPPQGGKGDEKESAALAPVGVAEPCFSVGGGRLNQLIRAGYARNAPIAELMAETGLSGTAITSRAKRMGLGDRDRQRAAVAEANKRRGAHQVSPPLQHEPQQKGEGGHE